ncbi:MAG: hypothetical protein BWY02_02784 [bacterium ADurb.Bin157]|nr:MAG: hypothetical protein BWY02_02784 [bacterium ADurb.Bin157]
MKSKIIILLLIACFILGWANYSQTEEKNPMLLALNCIKPIKPILPIKPIWCTGKWTLILECDQYCNCVWVPTCIEN